MAKLQSSYFVCFAFSIFVNLLFVLKLYVGGEWELSWSRRAAEEAEHVAAISCSGHGRAYLDGLVLDGKEPVCECNSCYGGPDCSEFLTACAANADSFTNCKQSFFNQRTMCFKEMHPCCRTSQMILLFIEFVTSPNNPDGHLNKAFFQGPNAKAIYDRVYYWPHFTAIPAPADDELMIFSISKFTGHAGSRFGWAVVKDESVYKRMSGMLS